MCACTQHFFKKFHCQFKKNVYICGVNQLNGWKHLYYY